MNQQVGISTIAQGGLLLKLLMSLHLGEGKEISDFIPKRWRPVAAHLGGAIYMAYSGMVAGHYAGADPLVSLQNLGIDLATGGGMGFVCTGLHSMIENYLPAIKKFVAFAAKAEKVVEAVDQAAQQVAPAPVAKADPVVVPLAESKPDRDEVG